MPFVNVQTIKGIMTAEQKSELLRRMTDLLVEIEGQGDPQFRQSMTRSSGAWGASSRRKR
ncbi:tautomerase [Klebsiella quasipneumoniae]|nr:tautomerase [Klebsiella quasipneumoniae]